MGLPGSGKSTLARAILDVVDTAVYWNADDVRANINSHLKFSLKDRIKQAETMKWLSDRVVESGNMCVIDFVCPTPETRKAFNTKEAYVIWVDRIEKGPFEDTNELFIPPDEYDFRVEDKNLDPEMIAAEILHCIF